MERKRAAALAPELRRLLLQAYDAGKRDLPWRGESDPYRVWVSEVMLQQTRVETVIPYYRAWVVRFPDLESLARAEEVDVLRAWKGLGYYSRARNLQRGARVVRDRFNGQVPADPGALRSLPGVGEYTAGAVASIAFGQVVPAVDGNVRRVLSRVFDLPDPGEAVLRELASELVDPHRPGDFNQALMELGALVCAPRSPACGECPLQEHCQALKVQTVDERPARKKRKPIPEVEIGVVVAVTSPGSGIRPAGGVLPKTGVASGTGGHRMRGRHSGLRFFLRRRPRKGLLAGMWEFPGVELKGEAPDTERLIERVQSMAEGLGMGFPGRLLALPAVPHTFTHLKALYRPFLVEVASSDAGTADAPGRLHAKSRGERKIPGGEAAIGDGGDWGEGDAAGWLTPDQVADLPLPVAQEKIFREVMELLGSASPKDPTATARDDLS